jgi:hypothetical protein
MTRDTKIQIGALAVLLSCLLASGGLAVTLSAVAGRAKLTYADRAEDAGNKEVALGIAMGAFRGIFVNFLWIRANALKEAGKFHEAIELSSAITRLQPRFSRVWVFHAWNMSYNISVSTQTPEERWSWVNAGINLLREKGVPANPNDMLLHKELGWIFLHKIGGYTDDANAYYKRRLAEEWTIVLGPPPGRTPEDRDRSKAIAKCVAFLTPIEEAPPSIEGVVAAEPSARTLLDRLASEVGVTFEHTDQVYLLLTQYERYRAVTRSNRRALYEQNMGPRTIAFGALMQDPAMERAWQGLIPHLRRRMLVEKYHMDPARMIRYTQKYGPMDWRHHAAHSLYWAQKGVEAGKERWTNLNKLDYDFLNTDRIVAQSVQDLYRTGDLYFDFLAAAQGQYAFLQGVPSPHFVESYGGIIQEMRERSWADNTDNRGTTPLSAGYENFLKDAVLFFYRRGEIDVAQKWQNELINYPELNLNNPYRIQELSVPLPEFVANELRDRLTSPSIMISQVSAGLMSAYASGLLGGDPDLFLAQFEFAKRVHGVFMNNQFRNTPAGGENVRMEQMDRDFRMVAGGMFHQFIAALDIDDAETVYQAAPPDLRRWAYAQMVETYKEEFDARAPQTGRTFAQAFPEPEGMEEFERFLAQYQEDRNRRANPAEQK